MPTPETPNAPSVHRVEPTRKADGFGVLHDAWKVVTPDGRDVASFHRRSQAERHREFRDASSRPLR